MARWLLLTLILAAGYALGTALFSRAERIVLDGPRRKVLFRLALGLGLLAYAVFGLGLLGWLRSWVGWVMIVSALACGAPALAREERARRRMRLRTEQTRVDFRREEVWPHVLDGGRWPRILTPVAGLLLGLVALAALLIAVAPPVAYDDLTYHLAAPKIYARTGAVRILPYDHHTAFPFTVEMLSTLCLLIGDAELAKLLQTVFWALALLAVFTLGHDHLGPRVGWLAVILYACTPVVFCETGTAYTEFAFALYQLLAVLAFLEYLNHRVTAVGFRSEDPRPAARQPHWIWVVGVLTGLTIGCKLTGGLLAIFLAVAVAVLGRTDGLTRRAVRADLLALLTGAGLIASPWLLRTWIATGNPVFPFAHGVFHSPLWSDDRAAAYDSAQKAFGQALNDRLEPVEADPAAHRRWWRLATVAWHVTFSPSWYYDRGLNFDGKARLGPAYLALGVPALIFWLVLAVGPRGPPQPVYEELRDETVRDVYTPEFGREVAVAETRTITERVVVDPRRVVALLLAYTTIVAVFWFATMQYARYLVPHLALWAVLAAWAADGLLRLRVAAAAAVAVIGIQVLAGLAYALVACFPAMQVQLGGLATEQYAAAPLRAYGAMQWINDATAPDAKVILYGEPRGYWLDRDYLWGERGHSTLIPDAVRTDAGRYVDFLTDRLGVTHALVYETVFPLGRTTGGDDIALVSTAIERGRFRRVWADPRRAVSVYEVQ